MPVVRTGMDDSVYGRIAYQRMMMEELSLLERDDEKTSALRSMVENVEYFGTRDFAFRASGRDRESVHLILNELLSIAFDEELINRIEAVIEANISAWTNEVTAYRKPRYVVGFLFDSDLREVILIRKLRPDWQAGKYNGVGGQVRIDEDSLSAMTREFEEETGIYVAPSEWFPLFTDYHEAAVVDFFYSVSGSSLPRAFDVASRRDNVQVEMPEVFLLSSGWPAPEKLVPRVADAMDEVKRIMEGRPE